MRHYERFSLTSTQQTVTVPVTGSRHLNIYVSVLLIRGRTSDDPGADGSDPRPRSHFGYAELTVDATKKLGVKVSADRADTGSVNVAKVSVSVADGAGGRRPVRGDAVGFVDHGVLSLTGYRSRRTWSARSIARSAAGHGTRTTGSGS